MKKHFFLLVFLFFCLFSVTSRAHEIKHMHLASSLLTEDEALSLEQEACDIAQSHDFDIAIIAQNSADTLSPQQYAEKYFIDNNFGFGAKRNGLILSVKFGADSGYCFYPSGSGNQMFTPSVAEKIFDECYPYYVNGEDYNFYSSLLSHIKLAVSKYTPPASVNDTADVLTAEQETQLLGRINSIAETYKFDVVLLTADDTGDKTPEDFAALFYKDKGYGFGENKDGILFLILPHSSESYIFASGYGEEAFNSYGKDAINLQMVNIIKHKDFHKVATLALDNTELFLKEAFENVPFSPDNPLKENKDFVLSPLWIFLIILISTGVLFILLRLLNGNKQKSAHTNNRID